MGRSELENGTARLVEDLLASGLVSGVVALVGTESAVLATASGGRRTSSGDAAPTSGSLFDLASLSKPLTGTLAIQLEKSGVLRLETRLGDIWGSAVDHRLARVTLEDLLRHRAGLRPWMPLYARCANVSEAVETLLSGSGLGAKHNTYSDLGFILWGASAEQALGSSLTRLLRRYVLSPLRLNRQITPSRPDSRRVVACEMVPNKEAEMAREQGFTARLRAPQTGEIQDGNARWWGGYAGHAGLFGSGKGLLALAREWLRPKRLDHELVRRALTGRGAFLLGWRRPTGRGAGTDLSRHAFGHTGFTGGSVWIDPQHGLVYVLLGHRTSDMVDLDPWRRRLHGLGRRFSEAGRQEQ